MDYKGTDTIELKTDDVLEFLFNTTFSKYNRSFYSKDPIETMDKMENVIQNLILSVAWASDHENAEISGYATSVLLGLKDLINDLVQS